MRLFPLEANFETEIQVQMVYLEVIPENTREDRGEGEGKQHGTVSRIRMWAMGSILLGTSQRLGRSKFGVISWGPRRLGYLSSNFSHSPRAPPRGLTFPALSPGEETLRQ